MQVSPILDYIIGCSNSNVQCIHETNKPKTRCSSSDRFWINKSE